jgi:outer membrane protein assembly factor BamB
MRFIRFGIAMLMVLGLSACDWPMFHHDAMHTGFNLDAAPNKGALSVRFTAPARNVVFSSAAIADGVVYVGSDRFYAFDANGSTNCSGTPATCAPLWTGSVPSGAGFETSPAVVNGIAYIAGEDAVLYAFDAAGVTNCSGTPKTCSPLWGAPMASFVRSSPVVANGVVYIGGSRDTIEAFDASGNTNCAGAPKVCAPLWTGTAPAIIGAQDSVPAVGNGLVYVGARDGNLYAFDAAGTTNCGGSPRVCSPIWAATTTAGVEVASSPAISGDTVYVGADNLYAFDALTGARRWVAPTAGSIESSPALGNGLVYVGDSNGTMLAFDAGGVSNCSGPPKICTPIWASQASTTIFLSSPAVANGVVYIGSFHDVHAFDAINGAPLSHFTTGGFVQASPAVSNGTVYVGSGDGNLYALTQSP